MTTVGILKIGFVEQNKVNDTCVQQEQQQQQQNQRAIPDVYLIGGHWFKSIDQQNAILTERSSIGADGKMFEQELQFTVRITEDIALGKKYLNRPIVIHVWTVDGKKHVIGSKSYPAYLESNKRYDGVNTQELAMTATYTSTTSLVK